MIMDSSSYYKYQTANEAFRCKRQYHQWVLVLRLVDTMTTITRHSSLTCTKNSKYYKQCKYTRGIIHNWMEMTNFGEVNNLVHFEKNGKPFRITLA